MCTSDTSSVTATSDDFITVSVELLDFRMLLLLFIPHNFFITEGLILAFSLTSIDSVVTKATWSL